MFSSVQEQCYVHASQRLERETAEERGDVLSKPNRRPDPAMGGREARSLWRLPLLMVLQVRFYPGFFFHRLCGFENNRISETLSLGEKSLSLAKNPFILMGEIWNFP